MSPYREADTKNGRFVGRTTYMDDAWIRAFCIGEAPFSHLKFGIDRVFVNLGALATAAP